MENDVVVVHNVVHPRWLSGRVLRTLESTTSTITEAFRLVLETDDQGDREFEATSTRGVVVDSYAFEHVPGTEPALVYRRSIAGVDQTTFDPVSYFAGNMAADGGGIIEFDLSTIKPMAEDDFWGLVEGLGRRLSARSVAAFRRSLVALGESRLLAFESRLRAALIALRTQAIADQTLPESGRLASDSFLFWRLATIARGRASWERAVSGHPDVLSLDDESDGDRLATITEDAFEALTGVVPLFYDSSTQPSVPPTIAAEGVGTVDRSPGPRDLPSLYERGLAPLAVGSRFIVAEQDGHAECVVLQRIDIRNENVALHLHEAASEVAGQLGGTVVSPIEFYEANEHLWTGETIFEIRRRWRDSLESYRSRYLS